jgi:hypothetical protein
MSVQKLYYIQEDPNGFYPTLKKISKGKEIYITFLLCQSKKDYYWLQINGSVIYGLIKTDGNELLSALNNDIKEYNIYGTRIMNKGHRQIYPITNRSTFYILENYYK